MALTREQKDIARRWCTFNCWGWPADLPKPPMADRSAVASREMAKAVRAIGIQRCLEYWNSEEFQQRAPSIVPEFGYLTEASAMTDAPVTKERKQCKPGQHDFGAQRKFGAIFSNEDCSKCGVAVTEEEAEAELRRKDESRRRISET